MAHTTPNFLPRLCGTTLRVGVRFLVKIGAVLVLLLRAVLFLFLILLFIAFLDIERSLGCRRRSSSRCVDSGLFLIVCPNSMSVSNVARLQAVLTHLDLWAAGSSTPTGLDPP